MTKTDVNKTVIVYIFIFLESFCFIHVEPLTGHVCRRQKEETYRVTTNRAFLCSERYTTSCGHLDWRRCTKYRIQTCYTPAERYARRYREVEECCPGWQEAGGSCTIPACYGICQNGGVCTETAAIPHCSCLPGFHGDMCQHRDGENLGTQSTNVPAWMVPVVVAAVIAGAVVVAVVAVCFYRTKGTAPSCRSRITTAVATTSSQTQQGDQSPEAQPMLPSAPGQD